MDRPTRLASPKPLILVKRAESDEQRTDSAIRLQVRRAYAGLRAAQQRIEVAKAAVAEAEESLRITQNRYEAGMNNVTDLSAHGNRRVGEPHAIPGGDPRSADRRHHARTCRGPSQCGFGGFELNEALFPVSADPGSSAGILRK